LIVTCEECSTSFQLDEARIPASGAQVRCSRCKHAFFLPHPSASQSQATDAIAEEAAHDPMSSVPPVASDAPEPASNADVAAPDAEPEEEDWQFSEEIRNEGDEELEAEGDFGVGQDFGSGLDADEFLDDDAAGALDQPDPGSSSAAIESADLNSRTESGLELESDSEPLEPVRDESNFGSVDDFSSLMEDDDVAQSDLGTEVESELSTVESIAEGAGVYASRGTTDDLGDPESWDLVGNHDYAVSKPRAGSIGASFQDEALGSGIAIDDEGGESAYEEEIGPVSPHWQRLALLGHGIGWAVTIVFAVGALGLGLRSEWTRSAQSPQTVSLGALTAETTRASWVETSRSGFVLVVAGQLRNTGSVPLWPATVQLAFLDVAGQRLAGLPIQVGERLAESVLREASPGQLIVSAAAAALRLRGTPLEPGESRFFEAVALEDRLPEGARRILLEIGESAIRVDPARPVQVEEESEFSP